MGAGGSTGLWRRRRLPVSLGNRERSSKGVTIWVLFPPAIWRRVEGPQNRPAVVLENGPP